MVTERTAADLSVWHDGNVDVTSSSDSVDVKVCMTVQHLPSLIRSTIVCSLDRVSRSQHHQSVVNIETCSEVFSLSTHRGVNQRSRDVRQTQQRPGPPTVTLTWHASKLQGNKRHQYTLCLLPCHVRVTVDDSGLCL